MNSRKEKEVIKRNADLKQQLARWRGGVDVLLIGNKIDAQALEFLQGIDQGGR